MSDGAGVLRSAGSLARTAAALHAAVPAARGSGTGAWELTNLVTVATALVAAAYARTETRGCHWRDDFPVADDRWRGHLTGALAPDGRVSLTWERV
jgi:L-aspartate oxidase